MLYVCYCLGSVKHLLVWACVYSGLKLTVPGNIKRFTWNLKEKLKKITAWL